MTRAKLAAGILLFRWKEGVLEVFLAHPGGPYWAEKDLGSWTMPKGEPTPDEDPLACARRELEEETGVVAQGPFIELGEIRQKAGKTVLAWAAAGDADPAVARSNSFMMEWPPRSGRMASFPEVDRCSWFRLDEARRRINPAQTPLLDRLAEWAGGSRR